MSDYELRLDPTEFQRTRKLLRSMKGAMVDLRPVFDGPIDASVVRFFRQRFSSAGTHGGDGPWAPNRPVTKLLKRRRGHGRGGIASVAANPGGVLTDTNALVSSLVKRTGPGVIRRFDKNTYERGTSDPAAKYAQRGFTSVMFPAIGLSRGGRPERVTWLRRSRPRKVAPRVIIPKRMPTALLRAWDGYLAKFIERGGRVQRNV